jgi:hypothetical protein
VLCANAVVFGRQAFGRDRRRLCGRLAALDRRHAEASTVRFYTDNLSRHVRPLLGIRPIASVTRADCRELVATTIRRLSLEAPRPWTIRFDCVLFRVSVRLALRHETR